MLIYGRFTEEEYDLIVRHTPSEKELAERKRRREREAEAAVLKAQRAGARPASEQSAMVNRDNHFDDPVSDTTSLGIDATFYGCNIHHEDAFESSSMLSSSSTDIGISISDSFSGVHMFDPTSYDMADVISPANIHHDEFFGSSSTSSDFDSCSPIDSTIGCGDINDPFST